MPHLSARWLFVPAAIFLLVGVIGFGSSLAASRCLKYAVDPADRLSACQIASATTLSRFVASDEEEFARIEFERAIVLTETGRVGEGEAVMRDLFDRVHLRADTLALPSSSLSGTASFWILERAQRLDPGSDVFASFARALERQ